MNHIKKGIRPGFEFVMWTTSESYSNDYWLGPICAFLKKKKKGFLIKNK